MKEITRWGFASNMIWSKNAKERDFRLNFNKHKSWNKRHRRLIKKSNDPLWRWINYMKNAKISNKVWEMYNPKEEIANEIFILSIVYLAKEKVLMLIYKISFHLKVKPT